MRAPQHSKKSGFTLLELLIVVVIIGLLVGLVGPRYFAQLGKSEEKTALAQISLFGQALTHYRLDTGHYPSSSQGLQALVIAPSDEPKWAGPYLAKAVPMDPWGHPYRYTYPNPQGEYEIALEAHQ